jgi:hypothetical protein
MARVRQDTSTESSRYYETRASKQVKQQMKRMQLDNSAETIIKRKQKLAARKISYG